MHCNLRLPEFGYLAAFSNAGDSKLSDSLVILKTTPNFALFDPMWKLVKGWRRSLYQLLKLYLRRTAGIHLMVVRCADAEHGGLIKKRKFRVKPRKRDNCECIAAWGRSSPLPLYLRRHAKFDVTEQIAFLLLIHYFMPWPWSLTSDLEHLQRIACDAMKLCTKFERNRTIRGGVIVMSVLDLMIVCFKCCARL